mmetsp:Transcript_30807/g.42169  ORF Transcript_30807/g.42169 Transcript_30807/m.42169 type:complete len:84 (-) Transcript_30807:94-345(-)
MRSMTLKIIRLWSEFANIPKIAGLLLQVNRSKILATDLQILSALSNFVPRNSKHQAVASASRFFQEKQSLFIERTPNVPWMKI